MKIEMKKMAVTALLVVGAYGLSGCGMFDAPKPPPVEETITCNDVLSHGVSNFSEQDVVDVLHAESQSKDLNVCWIPVMQSALQEGVVLPQDQLKMAIKQLNREQYNAIFHEAVYRYLAGIARGNGTYRSEDQALLRAYCSYLINHVKSSDDGRLGQVQLLTKRLDPEMYERFFE